MTYDDWKCTEPEYYPEPDCPDCEDGGFFYGNHGEIIYCHCGATPSWKKHGGYSFGGSKADIPDDVSF
jgi:hypothetical protein